MSQSVTLPIRRAMLPCLPGCTEDHAEQFRKGRPVQECQVLVPIGTASSTVSDASVVVQAYAATEDTERYPAVVLSRTDLPFDYETELTSAQARELAALILAAADRADQIIRTPVDAA